MLKGLIMVIDPSFYEDEFLDDESDDFFKQKLTHKSKVVKQRQKDVIRQKRKAKIQRQEQIAESEELSNIFRDELEEEEEYHYYPSIQLKMSVMDARLTSKVRFLYCKLCKMVKQSAYYIQTFC